MSNTVRVKNISSQTSEKEVRDFFSFCGRIQSLSVTSSDAADGSKSATVTFDKETAAKTALLLDNTQLGSAQVHVEGTGSHGQATGDKTAGSADESDELSQEDKPRSRILAEYLAHGYVISDSVIERAIALDNQHGISNRFTKALQDFDAKYKASEKAQDLDAKYGVSEKATGAWHGLNSYFEKALETPTGQRIRGFYQTGNKQVLDVHNEARHLADLKTGKSETSKNEPTKVPGQERTTCQCGADTGKCPCAPGTCACKNCAKNPDEKTSSVNAESAQMEKVPGTEKTKCNCGSDSGKCPCEPGKCACGSCAKNTDASTTA